MTTIDGTWVNDIHAQLNRTRVKRIESPDSLDALRGIVMEAIRSGEVISVAGGRHSSGGQQFASDGVLVDMGRMNRVLHFDPEAGRVEMEAGIQWPAVVNYLVAAQEGQAQQWGIAQKQTGGDRMSLGGALSVNAHGRVLRRKPLIGDIDSFVLIDADGNPHTCSRGEKADLFRLAIGGYGMLGIVASITLRLVPRQKLERVVEIVRIEDLIGAFEQRIRDGFLYGDCQFDHLMARGVISTYRPVDPSTPIPQEQRRLTDEDWGRLIYLAHTDKKLAFEAYAQHYLSTSGQIYWSDTHQLSPYFDDYHRRLDLVLRVSHPASEVLTELFVPRPTLVDFLGEAREDFSQNNVDPIYGTIRLIESDAESFLPWAKQSYSCVIFNLHTVHTPEGIEHSAAAFRRLIDMAIRRGGSYYLTYHRFATREQVLACYPQFPEYLRQKRHYDPQELFQSDWYRHYKEMFAAP